MSNEIIGITGPIAAGKDTAARYLSHKLEVPVFRISDPLKNLATINDIEPTRENLIALGTEIAKRKGDEYLAQLILDKAPQRMIVTGLRQLGQLALFGSHSFNLLSIDADASVRFNRAVQNRKLGEARTYEEFMSNETKESRPPNTQRLPLCMDSADYHIQNNDSLEQLHDRLDEAAITLRL